MLGNRFGIKKFLGKQYVVMDFYRPRSRGDNAFGSVRVFVCLFRNSALPSSAEKTHDTQIRTHLPLSVQGICVCL